jgi:hypothetical protein
MIEFVTHEKNNLIIAEIISDGVVITETQEALDIMANLSYNGINGIILHEKHLTPKFFDLSSRLAGMDKMTGK